MSFVPGICCENEKPLKSKDLEYTIEGDCISSFRLPFSFAQKACTLHKLLLTNLYVF